MRFIGIVLVVAGPALITRPEKAAAPVGVEGETAFTPRYVEGYAYALLSTVGFGLSPILIGLAFTHKGLGVGIAGGFVSYLAATVALGFVLLWPGEWMRFRALDRDNAKWFLLSGIAVCLSQMLRYMALAIAPVSVVAPIQRLSLVFRIYFGWMINPKHEVFGGRVISGTIISLVGAVALSISANDVVSWISMPQSLAAWLTWQWSY